MIMKKATGVFFWVLNHIMEPTSRHLCGSAGTPVNRGHFDVPILVWVPLLKGWRSVVMRVSVLKVKSEIKLSTHNLITFIVVAMADKVKNKY